LFHSGPWFLITFAAEGRMGADVKVMRSLPDLVPRAMQFFTEGERHSILAAPERTPREERTGTLPPHAGAKGGPGQRHRHEKEKHSRLASRDHGVGPPPDG